MDSIPLIPSWAQPYLLLLPLFLNLAIRPAGGICRLSPEMKVYTVFSLIPLLSALDSITSLLLLASMCFCGFKYYRIGLLLAFRTRYQGVPRKIWTRYERFQYPRLSMFFFVSVPCFVLSMRRDGAMEGKAIGICMLFTVLVSETLFACRGMKIPEEDVEKSSGCSSDDESQKPTTTSDEKEDTGKKEPEREKPLKGPFSTFVEHRWEHPVKPWAPPAESSPSTPALTRRQQWRDKMRPACIPRPPSLPEPQETQDNPDSQATSEPPDPQTPPNGHLRCRLSYLCFNLVYDMQYPTLLLPFLHLLTTIHTLLRPYILLPLWSHLCNYSLVVSASIGIAAVAFGITFFIIYLLGLRALAMLCKPISRRVWWFRWPPKPSNFILETLYDVVKAGIAYGSLAWPMMKIVRWLQDEVFPGFEKPREACAVTFSGAVEAVGFVVAVLGLWVVLIALRRREEGKVEGRGGEGEKGGKWDEKKKEEEEETEAGDVDEGETDTKVEEGGAEVGKGDS